MAKTLSDKITSNWVETDWDSEGNPKVHTNIPSIYVEHIKRAVKELKEEFSLQKQSKYLVKWHEMDIKIIIDKIFGDELI